MVGCYYGSLEDTKVSSCDEAAAMPSDCKLVAGSEKDFISSGKCNVVNTGGADAGGGGMVPWPVIIGVVVVVVLIVGCVVCYVKHRKRSHQAQSDEAV